MTRRTLFKYVFLSFAVTLLFVVDDKSSIATAILSGLFMLILMIANHHFERWQKRKELRTFQQQFLESQFLRNKGFKFHQSTAIGKIRSWDVKFKPKMSIKTGLYYLLVLESKTNLTFEVKRIAKKNGWGHYKVVNNQLFISSWQPGVWINSPKAIFGRINKIIDAMEKEQ